MQEHGLISIIMAAYNAESTIEQSISSVLRQTYTHWELLVIDDCSNDSTVSIVQKMAADEGRIYLILNTKNSGVSKTRRQGLSEAHGEWIAILDSDDFWTADKLRKQVALQKEKNGDLIYTGSAFIAADGSPISWYLHAPSQITYKELLKQNLISNSSALVRKTLYDKYYALGDDMHEDFAIWLSILKNNGRAYGIDEPLLVYRIAQGSKSGNKRKAAKMNWNTYRYLGLNVCQSFYYECRYILNGIMKYRHIIRSGQNATFAE